MPPPPPGFMVCVKKWYNINFKSKIQTNMDIDNYVK